MKEHKHLFKNSGGGCAIGTAERFPCDMFYECTCGENFKLLTTSSGYGYLPESFETQEWSEIKKTEQEAINDAILDKLS